MNKFFYFLLLFIISTGCSKITEQARLDRFNERLENKQNQITKQLNKDLELREKNISNIQNDIKFLKSKIINSKNTKNIKIKDSFRRYAKTLKAQGEVQLIHYEIDMLVKLAEKESKLNTVKNNVNKISSTQEQDVIKLLKKQKSKLQDKIDDLYIDISWFESVDRINLINAQKSAEFINQSTIYANEGNFDKAIKNVNKARKLTPNIPIIYAQLGSLYYLIGDNKSSLFNYKKAKEFNFTIDGIDDMISLLENKSLTR